MGGGTAVGVGNYITEELGFGLCRWLEARGLAKRFIKSNSKQLVEHSVRAPEGNLL